MHEEKWNTGSSLSFNITGVVTMRDEPRFAKQTMTNNAPNNPET